MVMQIVAWKLQIGTWILQSLSLKYFHDLNGSENHYVMVDKIGQDIDMIARIMKKRLVKGRK